MLNVWSSRPRRPLHGEERRFQQTGGWDGPFWKPGRLAVTPGQPGPLAPGSRAGSTASVHTAVRQPVRGPRGELNYPLTASNAPVRTGSPLPGPQGGGGGGAGEGRRRERGARSAEAGTGPPGGLALPAARAEPEAAAPGGGRSKPVSVTMATSFPGYLKGRVLRERGKEQLEKCVAARIWAGGQAGL